MSHVELPPYGTPDYWRAVRQLVYRMKVDVDRLWGAMEAVPDWGMPIAGGKVPGPISCCGLVKRYHKTDSGKVAWHATRLDSCETVQSGSAAYISVATVATSQGQCTLRAHQVATTSSTESGFGADHQWIVNLEFAAKLKVKIYNWPSTRVDCIATGGLFVTKSDMINESLTNYVTLTWDAWCAEVLPDNTISVPPISSHSTTGLGLQIAGSSYSSSVVAANPITRLAWGNATAPASGMSDFTEVGCCAP